MELKNTSPNRIEKLVSQALHRLPSATQTSSLSAGSLVQFKLCMILSLQLQMLLGDGKTRVKKSSTLHRWRIYNDLHYCSVFPPSLYRPPSPNWSNLSWAFHLAPSASGLEKVTYPFNWNYLREDFRWCQLWIDIQNCQILSSNCNKYNHNLYSLPNMIVTVQMSH